ncbi:uncharacterized protein LOC132031801 [Lycium ferocissimum]|uniref:uncharacterized protein LOC132031801 n=1 Tax=Lycium ferocissimum TaxID=112874 RepID=UPI0028152058|nr:uncharacterized protein LOC132031801 [Lycium ferocissimum]
MFWRICTMDRSMSRAVFPSITSNVKKLSSADYQTWWKKTHGDFLDKHLQTLMNIVGPIATALLEESDEVCANEVPNTNIPCASNAKLSGQHQGKEAQLPSNVLGEKSLTQVVYSSKRLSQERSESSNGDRNFKRVKARPSSLEDTKTPVVEISDSIGSPSKTMTAPIKESSGLRVLQREGSQDSTESISGPDLMQPPFTARVGKDSTSLPRDEVRERLSSIYTSVQQSVFDGKKVVLDHRKKFISTLWDVIQGKLSRSDVDCASSLEDEIRVILEEMDGKDVDDVEAARKESFIAAGERLSNAMLEEYEKVAEVSSIHQSLDKVKEKIEKLRKKERDLEALLEVTEKEVEEAKLGASTASNEFDACFDVDLSNADDLIDLERKKERLEAMRQDLINYKLCLD